MPRLSTGIGSVDDFLQQHVVLGAMQRPYFNSCIGKTCNVYRFLVLEGPREEAFRLLPGFLQSTEPRPTLVQSLCEILPWGARGLFMDLGFYDVDAKRGQQEAYEKLKKVLKKLCQDLKKVQVLPESMVGSCEDLFQEEGGIAVCSASRLVPEGWKASYHVTLPRVYFDSIQTSREVMQWFAGRVLDMGLVEGKPGKDEDRPATRKSCVDTTVYHSRRNLRLVTETKWRDPGNVKRTRLEPLNYRTNLSAHMVAPGPPPADAVILTPGVLQSILPRTYQRSTSARKAAAEPLPGPGTTQADDASWDVGCGRCAP